MTSSLGMNPQEIRRLANDLKARAHDLERIVGDVDRITSHLQQVWHGRDSEEFHSWWTSKHRPAARAAIDSIGGLGQAAANNVAEQEKTSSVTPGAFTPVGPIIAKTVGAVSAAGAAAAAAAAANAAPPVDRGPSGNNNYTNSDSVAKARAEVGTSRPTGWNQQGECVKSVQRWVNAAGGHFVGGAGPTTSYVNSGAVSVNFDQLQPGDVIQYTSDASPDSWDGGVHTMLVAGKNPDGTLDIIQSNSPAGSGLVTEVKNFTPHPPKGFSAHYWRFGKV